MNLQQEADWLENSQLFQKAFLNCGEEQQNQKLVKKREKGLSLISETYLRSE